MNLERLAEVFDGAKWVQVTEYGIFVWQGGHGLHLYDENLREIGYWSVGDFARSKATLREIHEAINDILSELA